MRAPRSSGPATWVRAELPAGHPLVLILARNLVASVTVPAFVTDEEGAVVFYNDAAGELLGRRFEETSSMAGPRAGQGAIPLRPGPRATSSSARR